jgi:hypothetical protein
MWLKARTPQIRFKQAYQGVEDDGADPTWIIGCHGKSDRATQEPRQQPVARAQFRARARARRVVPISELVFGALTQNQSSLEDRTTTRHCHRASGKRRVST